MTDKTGSVFEWNAQSFLVTIFLYFAMLSPKLACFKKYLTQHTHMAPVS